MSVRYTSLMLLALTIAAPAHAIEYFSSAGATDEYLVHLSQSAEAGDTAYAPEITIIWSHFLSERPPPEQNAIYSAEFGSSDPNLLLEDRAFKPKINRKKSDYEQMLDAISAAYKTSADGDASRMISFENSNLAISDLRYIYDGIVPSSASVKTDGFGDDSSCLNYLYQMSVTSMKSDAAHRMAPTQAVFNYNMVSTQSSGDNALFNLFASDTYHYRKDTVNPDTAKESSAVMRFSGSSDGIYSSSISNLAHLNSIAPDRENAEPQESYSNIKSNLNTLLKDDEDKGADTIASKSASIFTEYSLVYSNHSSRKQRSDKIAVVVGVNSYSDRMKLHACVNDAKAMAELLGELGYEVVELTDESPIKPTKENILNVAIAKIKSSRSKDKVIFYFSGHGETDENGTFYMVPQDSRRDPSSYISEYDLEMYLRDIKNLAIIIDSCHSGGIKDLVSEGQILIASFYITAAVK